MSRLRQISCLGLVHRAVQRLAGAHLDSTTLGTAPLSTVASSTAAASQDQQQITAAWHQLTRGYSLRIDFNPVETASRVYDVETIHQFLPNRKDLLPHFSASGVTLIPANLPPAPGFDEPLQADSVKRKRKTKMKKHKHRKRLKMLRHKSS